MQPQLRQTEPLHPAVSNVSMDDPRPSTAPIKLPAQPPDKHALHAPASLISLRASTPSDPSDASPRTASSATPSTSAASDSERSASETYLTDFGGPVLRDDSDWADRVSREDVVRAYASSSDADADEPAVETRTRAETEVYAEWAVEADEALELEELQEQADMLAGEFDGVSSAASSPLQSEHSDLMVDDLSDLQLDSADELADVASDGATSASKRMRMPAVHIVQEFERKEDEESVVDVQHEDAAHEYVGVVDSDKGRSRLVALQHRMEQVVNQLAQLQIVTAGRAADAQERKGDGLYAEARRLHAMLDHLARLLLQQAFQVRDQLEAHL